MSKIRDNEDLSKEISVILELLRQKDLKPLENILPLSGSENEKLFLQTLLNKIDSAISYLKGSRGYVERLSSQEMLLGQGQEVMGHDDVSLSLQGEGLSTRLFAGGGGDFVAISKIEEEREAFFDEDIALALRCKDAFKRSYGPMVLATRRGLEKLDPQARRLRLEQGHKHTRSRIDAAKGTLALPPEKKREEEESVKIRADKISYLKKALFYSQVIINLLYVKSHISKVFDLEECRGLRAENQILRGRIAKLEKALSQVCSALARSQEREARADRQRREALGLVDIKDRAIEGGGEADGQVVEGGVEGVRGGGVERLASPSRAHSDPPLTSSTGVELSSEVGRASGAGKRRALPQAPSPSRQSPSTTTAREGRPSSQPLQTQRGGIQRSGSTNSRS